MNNSINTDRPDFHCIHKVRDAEYSCVHQCDYCKNHDALLSTVKRLQEENERYKKALIAVRDFDDDNMDYDDPGAIAIEALKQLEQ